MKVCFWYMAGSEDKGKNTNIYMALEECLLPKISKQFESIHRTARQLNYYFFIFMWHFVLKFAKHFTTQVHSLFPKYFDTCNADILV